MSINEILQITLPFSVIPFAGRLELDFKEDLTGSPEKLQTPAPPSTRPTRARRRVRCQDTSSDEETLPTSVVPTAPCTVTRRSERASKTAAVVKMTANRAVRTNEDEIAEEEDSEVTSDESSDESGQITE